MGCGSTLDKRTDRQGACDSAVQTHITLSISVEQRPEVVLTIGQGSTFSGLAAAVCTSLCPPEPEGSVLEFWFSDRKMDPAHTLDQAGVCDGASLCALLPRKELVAKLPKDFQTLRFGTGVLHYLGTRYRTQSYENPHVSKQVLAAMSSIGAARGTASNSFTVDRQSCCKPQHFVEQLDPVDNFTAAGDDQWMSVDLGSSWHLRLEHYCLRHSGAAGGALRNWLLQARNTNDQEWITLKRHDQDESLCEATPFGVSIWAVSPLRHGLATFSKFRIYQIGLNSEGLKVLSCAGIELFGDLLCSKDHVALHENHK